MISFPNAKINLGLHVVRKREDGFHDIETVFYPVDLHDSLEILPSVKAEASMHVFGMDLSEGDNLCLKAYNLLKSDFGLPPVQMQLIKRIPAGAGLGGGSSDAAHTLMLLNDLFHLGLKPPDLENYAARLGSDCPFFIANTPVFAHGRGEIFKPLHLDLSGKYLMIIKPEIHISTMEAYSLLTLQGARRSPGDLVQMPISDWKDNLINDFEVPVFKKYPVIKEIKENLYANGAVYASMSGSGSSVYGIFTTEPSPFAAYRQPSGASLFLCRL